MPTSFLPQHLRNLTTDVNFFTKQEQTSSTQNNQMAVILTDKTSEGDLLER